MVWKMEWNGAKILVWKMPEWNGMKDFKNGTEDNLPYFYIRFRAMYLQKNVIGMSDCDK